MNKDKLIYLKKKMEENNLALLEALDDFSEDRGKYDSLQDFDAIE